MTRELMLLRLEGAATTIVAVGIFWAADGPWLLFALLFLAPDLFMLGYALAWAAHIGFDRALGYGLKRPTGFKDTHLSGT